jgi:hypothetical protein
MRKLTVQKIGNTWHIQDWNFKTWRLQEINVNECTLQCIDMKGTQYFKSANDFVIKMYGEEKIYPEWNNEEVFVNYETEVLI